MEENWFGLNRGQMTSVGTKVNSTSQKLLACKISGIFVHWGPFYGTFWWSSLTLLPPFSSLVLSQLIRLFIFFPREQSMVRGPTVVRGKINARGQPVLHG